ncbi:CFEM domain-containing protein, partial [Balamuthia mandrillaris]
LRQHLRSLSTSSMPRLRYASSSTLCLLLLSLCCVALAANRIAVLHDNNELEAEVGAPRLNFHGNWCGPQHGGFQDCCDGKPCPSCVPPRVGQLDYHLSPNCTKECPPVDEVDEACVFHDTCTFVAGEACGLLRPAESCYCNCVLAEIACSSEVSGAGPICWYFRAVASCWFCNESATGADSKRKECDAWGGDEDLPLKSFCQNADAAVKTLMTKGEMAWQNTSCWANSTTSYNNNNNVNNVFQMRGRMGRGDLRIAQPMLRTPSRVKGVLHNNKVEW